MNLYMDLHMHSRYSDDGEFTPTALVEKCAASGIHTMAIADHNTALANEEASLAAAKYGIRYLPAIEIDCIHENTNFHLLGYQIDYKSRDFQEIEDNVTRQSTEASLKMLAGTKALGFSITEQDMQEVSKGCYWQNRWTGEMFAEVLLQKAEYKNHSLLAPYRPGGSRSDNPYVNFYWDVYAPGKPCHAPIHYPNMADMIDLIHQNGGLAVLAHPGQNLKGKEHLLSGLAQLGLDGMEVLSSYHSPEQTAYYYQQAKALHLKVTCGSDFHGKTKPAVQLGKFHRPRELQESDLLFSILSH